MYPKSLDAVIRAGDTMRAVVLASATNEGGMTHGISLVSSEAQQTLIMEAYCQAGVDPSYGLRRGSRYWGPGRRRTRDQSHSCDHRNGTKRTNDL